MPRIIIDEFARNKVRIIEESSRSLSGTLKRVKDIVEKFGDPSQKQTVLSQLNDVDQRLPTLGEVAEGTVSRIEKLFSNTPIIEISDSVKLRSAQRAIDKRAPFHRQRNGIDDAILIEVYSDVVKAKTTVKNRVAFISHNTKDFSNPNDSNKLPHPDIADCFSQIKSLYFITLNDALNRINPEYLDECINELEWMGEPRRQSELLEAIDEFTTKVWYNRHQYAMEQIESGIIKIVDSESPQIEDSYNRDILNGALRAAAEVEKKFGLANLGPWDDFDWGMINGKLSALRWVLGDEWDMLDT